jgi:nitroreductase
VDGDRITRVLKSAWRAPSAGHLQPQDFIVVRDPITKRKLVEAALDQSFIEEAPVVVVVCSDTRRNIERYGERAVKFYSVIDGAFASLIILLSVVDEGLGACFVGAFEDAVVSRVLGLPREVRPIGIIPIGYPAEKPKRLARIPLERRVHVDGYGSSKFTGALGKPQMREYLTPRSTLLALIQLQKVWAYVFITTREPKKVVQKVRKMTGVAKADGLFGSPDVIAIVVGKDIASMDAVIDRIGKIPEVSGTDSKVARWLD